MAKAVEATKTKSESPWEGDKNTFDESAFWKDPKLKSVNDKERLFFVKELLSDSNQSQPYKVKKLRSSRTCFSKTIE